MAKVDLNSIELALINAALDFYRDEWSCGWGTERLAEFKALEDKIKQKYLKSKHGN